MLKNFVDRHIGVNRKDAEKMLSALGVSNLEQLIDQTIPRNIRLRQPPELPEAMTEREYSEHITELASQNDVFTSYIGMGWYDTATPAAIVRNVFENPVWYAKH